MRIKRLSIATALALTAFAVMASSSFASVKWSHTSAAVTGTLTLKRNGGTPKTCTLSGSSYTLKTAGSYFEPVNPTGWKIGCGESFKYMEWAPTGSAIKTAKGYELGVYDILTWSGFGYRESAWKDRTWLPGYKAGLNEVEIPFTNAVGAIPSHLTLTNTFLGETNFGESVTASGTLNFLNGKANVTLSGE